MQRFTLEEAKRLVDERRAGDVFLFVRMEDGSFRCAPIDGAESHFSLFSDDEREQVRAAGTLALLPDKAKIWQMGALIQPLASASAAKEELEQLLARPTFFF
jgi:hypothetical protein